MNFAAFTKVYDEGQVSDLEIVCGERSFKVVSDIVCSKSAVLWRLSDKAESKVRTITIKDEDHYFFEYMLRFLYSEIYEAGPIVSNIADRASNSTTNVLLVDIKMISLGEKYEVKSLVSEATAHFKLWARNEWWLGGSHFYGIARAAFRNLSPESDICSMVMRKFAATKPISITDPEFASLAKELPEACMNVQHCKIQMLETRIKNQEIRLKDQELLLKEQEEHMIDAEKPWGELELRLKELQLENDELKSKTNSHKDRLSPASDEGFVEGKNNRGEARVIKPSLI